MSRAFKGCETMHMIGKGQIEGVEKGGYYKSDQIRRRIVCRHCITRSSLMPFHIFKKSLQSNLILGLVLSSANLDINQI